MNSIKEGDWVKTKYGPGTVGVIVEPLSLCKIVMDHTAWMGTHRGRVYCAKPLNSKARSQKTEARRQKKEKMLDMANEICSDCGRQKVEAAFAPVRGAFYWLQTIPEIPRTCASAGAGLYPLTDLGFCFFRGGPG